MEKYVVWYGLWLKVYCKKKMYWLQVIGLVVALFIVASISFPDGENVSVGIWCGGERYAKQLTQSLLNGDSAFSFAEYEEEESLYADVLAGKVECGFLFDKELDRKIEEGNLKKSIIYVGSSFSTKGETVQETVYAALFKIYSDEILKQSEADIYGDNNEERMQKLLALNHEYQNSDDIFQLEIKTANFGVKEENSPDVLTDIEPVKGMIGLFVFFVMFMAYGNRYGQQERRVDKALRGGERFGYACMNQLAAGTVPAIAGMIGILCFVDNISPVVELVRIVLLVAVSSVWITALGSLFKSGSSFAGAIISLLLVNLLVCPVFLDLETYVPAVRYIRLLLPLGWYLGFA